VCGLEKNQAVGQYSLRDGVVTAVAVGGAGSYSPVQFGVITTPCAGYPNCSRLGSLPEMAVGGASV
jgi:hypothetical protein